MIKEYREPIRPKDIEINRYYNCLIGDSYELCKVRFWSVNDDKTGVRVFNYAVTCYYTCKDLFVGTLAECREYLAERINYHGI